jgi:DNA-directed RNA polymerase subunit M/transcription elongation factor TFIIS
VKTALGGSALQRSTVLGFRLETDQVLTPDQSTKGAINAAEFCQERQMAKIAKTADRKKVMDTTKSTDCPKCGKPTRIVKRTKDRERNVPGGVYISCSACDFYEKL